MNTVLTLSMVATYCLLFSVGVVVVNAFQQPLVVTTPTTTSRRWSPATSTDKQFHTVTTVSNRHQESLVVLLASGKGFGSLEDDENEKEESAAATVAPKKGATRKKQSDPIVPSNINKSESPAGSALLQQMRRNRAEQRDAELRSMQKVQRQDESLAETPAAIPEQVAQRMGQRMVFFVGLPLVGVLCTFGVFWYMASVQNASFQPMLVAFSTLFWLVVGLLGISYSIFSTSWDEDAGATTGATKKQDESFLGWEEAQRNVKNVQDGLARSRENLILRERMATMSESELENALTDLDRRDAAKGQNNNNKSKRRQEWQQQQEEETKDKKE